MKCAIIHQGIIFAFQIVVIWDSVFFTWKQLLLKSVCEGLENYKRPIMMTEGQSANVFMTCIYFIRYAKQNVVLGCNSYDKFFCTLTNLWYENVII